MITLKDITLTRGTKAVLEGASLTIHPGEKVALIGRNGAGKSSLFALLTGSLSEDKGDFFMPAGWRLAQVAQHMPHSDDSATDFVLSGDTRLMEAQAQLAQAEAAGDGEGMALAHAALADASAHDARSRAQTLLMGLGFTVAELDNGVNTFSGGWRMRLQLARALMCPADLLLLDEPTNHLDLDALVWLESWLKRFAGTLIIISHDREFLDAVTRVTVHLEHALLTRYGGNYSTFEELRAQQIVLQQAAFEKQQDRIAHLQSFIDRFKAKATKAKQAQSRVKALERMERIAPVITAADFQFEFKPPEALPNPMLSFKGTVVGYRNGEQETTILRGIERTVLAGQRLGILGANGQGKSTFIKTIAGALPALAAAPTEGKGLSIGYFAQEELDILHPDDSPLGHMIRLAKAVSPQAREQELRNFLGSFRFIDEMVNQAVGTMSGGEKARLVLAMLVWQRPNLLLLDEPTNHLDLTTREALAMALNEFDGTVMLVSHDRALLRSVCDDFWLVGDGQVKPFDGDLDDYQRYLLEVAKAKREAAAAGLSAASGEPKAEAPRVNQAQLRREQAAKRQALSALLKPHQKTLAAAEQTIAAAETERERLNQQLMQAPAPAEIADIGRRLKQLEDDVEAAEMAWLEASETIEQLSAQADASNAG